jgi:hypothetical protein
LHAAGNESKAELHRPRANGEPLGSLVDARLTDVSGHAERLAALDMIQGFADHSSAITLGTDKGYDAADFVEELRTINVRPQNISSLARGWMSRPMRV